MMGYPKMITKILKHACYGPSRGSKTMNLYNKLTSVVRDPKPEVNNKTSVFIDTIYIVCIYIRRKTSAFLKVFTIMLQITCSDAIETKQLWK